VSVLGGPPRKLRDEAVAHSVSPDGSRIAFGTNKGPFGEREIWTMRPTGQDAHTIYRTDENCGFDWLWWLPGTDRVAYMRFDRGGASIITRDVRGGSRATILSEADLSRMSDPIWLADGRLLFTRDTPDTETSSANFWAMRIDPRSGR